MALGWAPSCHSCRYMDRLLVCGFLVFIKVGFIAGLCFSHKRAAESFLIVLASSECKNSLPCLSGDPLESHQRPLGVPKTFWILLSGLSGFFSWAGMWLSHYSIWTQGCCGGMQGYKPHLHTGPHAGHLTGLTGLMKLHPEPAWDCLSLSTTD